MGLQCYLRTQLSLLHGLAGFVAGFFCLYTIVSWAGPVNYLPNLVDGSGKFIPFNNGLPFVFECVVYGTGALCLLSFFMCVVANCLFKSTCIAFFHMLLTSICLAFSAMSASVVSVYYIVWCDLLQQAVAGSQGCVDAATTYDIRNASALMSSHRSLLEIQMAIEWSLFPLLCLTLLTYSVVLRIVDQPESNDGPIRYIILQDETTPLLRPVNQSSIQRGVPLSEHNSPVIVTEPAPATSATRSES